MGIGMKRMSGKEAVNKLKETSTLARYDIWT